MRSEINTIATLLYNTMTRFKQKVHTQTYMWLLRQLEQNNAWLQNEVLWAACPYAKLDITRQEFDELIRQMKDEEGWN